MYPLFLTSAALTVLTAAFSAILFARRLRAGRRHQARESARRTVEPAAMELLDGGLFSQVDPKHEAALAESLSQLAPMVTGETREAIGRYFESSGAVTRACARLADPRSYVRAVTAAQLGDMCCDQAELPLLQALNDGDRDVRLAAARSLGRLRLRSAAAPLLHALVRRSVPSAVATGALLVIGAAALPGIRALLDDDRSQARADAVELLGLLGNPADSVLLQARLVDVAPAVRSNACQALSRLGASDAKSAVEQAMADPEPRVRQSAAEALGQLGDRDSSSVLIHAAQTDGPDVARTAAEALTVIAPDLATRVAASSNASDHLRRAAVTAGNR